MNNVTLNLITVTINRQFSRITTGFLLMNIRMRSITNMTNNISLNEVSLKVQLLLHCEFIWISFWLLWITSIFLFGSRFGKIYVVWKLAQHVTQMLDTLKWIRWLITYSTTYTYSSVYKMIFTVGNLSWV